MDQLRCKVEDCNNKGKLHRNGRRYFIKGYCNMHYARHIRGVSIKYSQQTTRYSTPYGDIVYIPLGVNAKDGYAIVDEKYSHEVCKFKWHKRRDGYAAKGAGKEFMFLHHFIVGKPPHKLVTDHINRNKLDNRQSNLRHVSRSLNALNSGIRKNNISGHKNIFYSHRLDKWVVNIKRNRKNIHVGVYKSIEEAIKERDIAIKDVENSVF